MSPLITTILTLNLATGTIITMSSYHWLLAWMGLELNTLAILPIISKSHHPRATEASTKYFLTQAAASALILFSSLVNAQTTGQWNILQLEHPLAQILLTVALAMKLGLSPTHFWLPEVLQGSSLKTTLIIITWQKLAPTTILFLTWNQTSALTITTMGILSVLTGGLGGLNQTQLRKIIAFSSIAHLGWMATVITKSNKLALLNLTIYIMISAPLMLALILFSTKTVPDLTTTWTTSPLLTTLTMTTLLSLGGLPPLTGFLPKWLILEELLKQNMALPATLMAMMTLMSLFFYLRLSYSLSVTITPTPTMTTNKWRIKPNMTTSLLSTTLPLSLMTLPLMPLIKP
uniref:NADH-ubiquinone oxidoreductase chain 2 n=1 Tax=Anniella pulchra TaxID=51957 RepID=B8QDI0_ANNPU|nr:NADH dehydrogenase subunit 2 [Anniella pulchra]ACC68431.1 NADH dehydrogenase subunit 2 [Anniella pulchra]ACC68433.1 NADH dehydrogenase subunit 2 [Anniella pulchra]ACC68435.1 NADH dehydrogenase subunit 2 [Anniella pulchra]